MLIVLVLYTMARLMASRFNGSSLIPTHKLTELKGVVLIKSIAI